MAISTGNPWYLSDDTVTEKIIKMRTDNPDISYRDMGVEIGVSYEYVRLVCKHYAIPNTWHDRRVNASDVVCDRCGTVLSKYVRNIAKDSLCSKCRNTDKWYERHMEAQCPSCNTRYWILKSDRRVRLSAPNDPYCSRKCSAIGRWNSEKGFR